MCNQQPQLGGSSPTHSVNDIDFVFDLVQKLVQYDVPESEGGNEKASLIEAHGRQAATGGEFDDKWMTKLFNTPKKNVQRPW